MYTTLPIVKLALLLLSKSKNCFPASSSFYGI